MAFIHLILFSFGHLYPAHLRIHKDELLNNKKKQVIRPEKWDFFQIAHQSQQNCFFLLKNKRPIKWELYQNSFWVYVIWLVFSVVFENISCPKPDFILCQNVASRKWVQTQNRKFLRILWNFVKLKTSQKREVEKV